MDLVADSVIGDVLTVEVEEDDANKEPLKVAIVDDAVVIVAGNDGVGMDWLITTPKEASLLESLIKHFRFLVTGEAGGIFIGDTVVAGDGANEELAFLF